jgi:putative ABC transport system permease protein
VTGRRLLVFAWRESRFARRRLFLFLSAISLGVAALVAVRGFAANMERGVQEESLGLLGADARLSSRQPFGPRTLALMDSLRGGGTRIARMTSFASMALAPRTGATRLVQVRAPEAGYPFYGTIDTDPANAWPSLQTGRNAIVDPSLVTALRASIGDSISIGEARFRIVAALEKVPGDAQVASAFAPRVYIPARYLGETQLMGFGSRIDYDAFLRVSQPTGVGPMLEAHRGVLRSERVRSQTAAQAQGNLERDLTRLTDYLGLIGVFALLLGGIGVASAMGAYMAQKVDTVAVLRCLGATSRQVLTVYILQALVMGLAGALVGVIIGAGVQWILPRLVQGLLPIDVAIRPDGLSILVGIIVGIWTAIAFAALPLLSVRKISPLGALRRRVEPLQVTGPDPLRWAVWGLLGASVVLLLMVQVKSVPLGIRLAAGVGVALGVLWLTAWAVVRAVRALPRDRLAYPVRQGLANLFRPGNQTRTVVVALGFGVFLLATLIVIQHNLLRPLRTAGLRSKANLLFFDVQQDQQGPLSRMLAERHLPVLTRTPIVPMRIASVNGVEVRPLTPAELQDGPPQGGGGGQGGGPGGGGNGERRPGGWAARREYSSTFRDSLIESETAAGSARCQVRRAGAVAVIQASTPLLNDRLLFPAACVRMPGLGENGADAFPVSLESGIAGDLGVKIGDRIVWDVQGVHIPTVVAGLREVDWARLQPNFFAVFSTQALANAPQTWVMMTRADSARARAELQRDVVQRYANVSAIDLTLVQRALDDVVSRISLVIRFLAAFSVATGLIVLLGAVSTSRLQRVRESVLLKAIGATRSQIGAILFTEYLVLGLLAVIAGTVLALGASWSLSHWLFNLDFEPALLPLSALGSGIALLAVAVGVWASREVFQRTPLEAIREE